jgi:hypothetical protein
MGVGDRKRRWPQQLPPATGPFRAARRSAAFCRIIDAIIGASGLTQRNERYAVLAAADLPPAAFLDFLEPGGSNDYALLHVTGCCCVTPTARQLNGSRHCFDL